MEQLTATSILSLFETDKAQRQSFVGQIVQSCKEGEVNALNIHLQIKCMEDMISTIKEDAEYKKLILEEAEKYGKSFEYKNAKIEIKETGTKYNWSVCNDPSYVNILLKADEVDKEKKEREKFLKAIPEKGFETLTEEGEILTIYRPTKSSTTSIAVTLK